jgi:hypothetical protein
VLPLTETFVIVAPFAAIAAAIGVAYGFATATVVDGNAGAADRDGAPRVHSHSHRMHMNSSAPTGMNGAAENQHRGHESSATSSGWIADPASAMVYLRPC